MKKQFGGKTLFLKRADINTDEIIPAHYLTEVSKQALQSHLLEDLKLDGFDPQRDIQGKAVIVSGANFGCGSSREHAPWALEVNGITTVIAPSFARIFRQNMFNCGMLALEVAEETVNEIVDRFQGKDTEAGVDLDKGQILFRAGSEEMQVAFTLGEYDRALVEAGGWVEYADAHY